MGGKQSSNAAADGRTRAYSASDIPSSSGGAATTTGNGTHRAAGAGRTLAGPHYSASGRTPYATGVPMHPGTSGTAPAEAVDAAPQYSLPGPRTRSVGLGSGGGGTSVGARAQSSFSIPNSSSAGGATYSSSQDSDSSNPEEGGRERTGAGHGGPRLLIGSLPSHLSPHLFGEQTPAMIFSHHRRKGSTHPPRKHSRQATTPASSTPKNLPTSVCVDTVPQGVLEIIGITCFVSTNDGMVGPVHIATSATSTRSTPTAICPTAIATHSTPAAIFPTAIATHSTPSAVHPTAIVAHSTPTAICPTISQQHEMKVQPLQTLQAIEDLCGPYEQNDAAGPLYNMHEMSDVLSSPTFTNWKARRPLTPDSSPNFSPLCSPQCDPLSKNRMTEMAIGQISLIQTSERQAIAMENIQQTMKDQLNTLIEIKEVLCENATVVGALASAVRDLAAQKSRDIASVAPVTREKPSASSADATIPVNRVSPTRAVSMRRCLHMGVARQEETPVLAKKRRI